jgi:hypothetical protein
VDLVLSSSVDVGLAVMEFTTTAVRTREKSMVRFWDGFFLLCVT